MLLLFLTMNSPLYDSYNLVFYCSIKKKMKLFFFFAIMPVRACVCILCRRYQLCLCHTVPNEHIRPVSVCDERQTSLQWVAVAGQCGRHAGVCIVHKRKRHMRSQALHNPGFAVFSLTLTKTLSSIHVRLSVRRENRDAQTVNYQMTKLFYHWKGANEQSTSQWATELRTRLFFLSRQDMFLSISPAL